MTGLRLVLRRLFCRHSHLQAYRRALFSEARPYQRAYAWWCPDCQSVVLHKERVR